MDSRVAEALRAVLTSDAVLTDVEVLEEYAHDDAGWAPCQPPTAVVFALTIDDVVATMRVCRELSPVVLGMHAAVKKALDPRGLLNPGKAFPEVTR